MKITQLGVALVAAGVFGPGCGANIETRAQEPMPNPIRWTVTPSAGLRVPIKAKYDPGTYTTYGLKIANKRGRIGFYVKGDSSKASDRLDGPYGHADLQDSRDEIGFGAEIDFIDNERVRVTAGIGPKIVFSELSGTMDQSGFETSFSEKDTTYPIEARLEIAAKLSRRWRLTGEVTIERDFEENLLDESYAKASLAVEF